MIVGLHNAVLHVSLLNKFLPTYFLLSMNNKKMQVLLIKIPYTSIHQRYVINNVRVTLGRTKLVWSVSPVKKLRKKR